MNFFENKRITMPLAIVLAVLVVITSTFGIFIGVTSGEKIDEEKVSEEYNASKLNTANMFSGISEAELTAELDTLDKQLAGIVAGVNVKNMLYTDQVATLLSRFTAELLELDFASLKFKALKKNYPAAYEYIKAQQEAGATWETVGTIPFGITAGDFESFVVAAGAAAEHLGNKLLNVMLCAPSAYYDALVPALEALHIEKMPSLFGFVKATGLSGSKRVEFLLRRILAIIDPTLNAPLTYLCEMLPDFVINYRKSCEFINSNEKIAKKTKLKMPTIEEILSQVISALGMTQPPLDLDELSKTGTASVGESGYNGGKRVVISGDREVVFAYLANYIMGVLTYQNNFATVDKILTKDLKSDAVAGSPFASMLTSPAANSMIATLMNILAQLKVRQLPDAQAEVDAFNAESKDYSSLFPVISEDTLTTTLDTIDSTLATALAEADIEGLLFTDAFATSIAKITAKLCNKSFGDISFRAMSKTFPSAYAFVKAEQQAGKTWDDIEVIPFGITDGDREGFINACGAGAEHFGDALALCLMSDPHSYDNALLPLLEALHTGAMSDLKGFVGGQGLDSEIRMRQVTEKVLTILEPIKAAPITFLCQMLPELIHGFNKCSETMAANPNSAIKMPSINELLGDIVAGFGLTLPEYDFTAFTKMATAQVAESGNITGSRMELIGDREVVFMSLAQYIVEVLKHDSNFKNIVYLITDKIGIDRGIIDTIFELIDTVASLGSGLTSAA